jgi:hypothetical protein
VGYNLIRTVMFDAAKVGEVRLEQLSFKSALMRFGLWCAGLRAYPNNPAARKAMRAQAKCRNPM